MAGWSAGVVGDDVVEVAASASTWQPGKRQVGSRRMTWSLIRSGGSWPLTASSPSIRITGWMRTVDWPSQSRILSVVTGPSVGPADLDQAVVVEVGLVEVQVEDRQRVGARLIARFARCSTTGEGRCSTTGEQGGEGVDLADAEGLVVAGLPGGHGVAVQAAVEVGEEEGVAGDVELAGGGVLRRGGGVQHDVPGLLLRAGLAFGVPGGVVRGDGVGDDGVDGLRATALEPRGDLLVDPPGGFLGEGVGQDGDVAPLPGGDLKGGDAFPGLGEAVAELEGVGDQLFGGDRGRHRG